MRGPRTFAGVVLLAGPTALAFFAGGYFAQPRLIAAIVVWALVLALAVIGPAPLPRGRAGRLALAGLAAVTVWSGLSILWAPQAGPATDSTERLVLYTGALLLAIALLRDRRLQRAVEPAFAAGAAIVIGYGMSERLLPGLIDLERSRGTSGRLEQPITYWNAEGALAAVGLILCARLAGDRSRPPVIRLTAAAAAPLLAAGVYASFSRGAIAVAVLGLLIVAAAAPSRAQLRASAVVLGAGVAMALAIEALPGIATLEGDHRGRDGGLMIAALVIAGALAALLVARTGAEPQTAPRWYARLAPVAWLAATAILVGLVVGAVAARPSEAELSAGASASRLASVSSNRYEYWRVALEAFGREPLHGVGAGAFRVVWLQERRIADPVRDTHSIEFEMLADLGIVGLLAFALFVAGVAVAAREALLRERALAAGPLAAVVAWFLHASIDWDWQLPAVTLPAIVLAGLLIALAEPDPR